MSKYLDELNSSLGDFGQPDTVLQALNRPDRRSMEEVATIDRTAEALGVPYGVAEAGGSSTYNEAQAQQLNANPAAAGWVEEDPTNIAFLKDDHEALQKAAEDAQAMGVLDDDDDTISTLMQQTADRRANFDTGARAWKRGNLQMDISDLGLKWEELYKTGDLEAANEVERQILVKQEEMKSLQRSTDASGAQAIEQLPRMFSKDLPTTLGVALPIALLTGGTGAIAAAGIGSFLASQDSERGAYIAEHLADKDDLGQPLSRDEMIRDAWIYGTLSGGVEGFFDSVTAGIGGKLMKPFLKAFKANPQRVIKTAMRDKQFSSIMREILFGAAGVAGSEAGEEGTQQFIQKAVEGWGKSNATDSGENYYRQPSNLWSMDTLREVGAAALAGGQTGLWLWLMPGALHAVSRISQVQDAQNFAEANKQLADDLAVSKTKEMSPQRLEGYLIQIPAMQQKVLVPADAVQALDKEKGLNIAFQLGWDEESLAQAAEMGQDVSFELSYLQSHLDKESMYQISDVMRRSDGAPAAVEAADQNENIAADMAAAVDFAEDDALERAAVSGETDRLLSELRDTIRQAPHLASQLTGMANPEDNPKVYSEMLDRLISGFSNYISDSRSTSDFLSGISFEYAGQRAPLTPKQQEEQARILAEDEALKPLLDAVYGRLDAKDVQTVWADITKSLDSAERAKLPAQLANSLVKTLGKNVLAKRGEGVTLKELTEELVKSGVLPEGSTPATIIESLRTARRPRREDRINLTTQAIQEAEREKASPVSEEAIAKDLATPAAPAFISHRGVESVDDLYRLAKEAQPQFTEFIKGIAEKTGGEAHFRPGDGLKSPARVQRKIEQDYPDDGAKRVLDVLGATLLYDDKAGVEKAVTAIEQQIVASGGEIARKKDRFAKPSGGYKDFMLSIRMPNGFVTELLITTKAMSEAKMGVGHDLYEAMQAAETVWDNKESTKEEIAESWEVLRLLKKASEAFYSSTGEDSNKTASSSEIVEPLARISAMGAGRANSKLYPKLEPFLARIRKSPDFAKAYGSSSYSMNSSTKTGSLAVPISQGTPVKASRPSAKRTRSDDAAISETPAAPTITEGKQGRNAEGGPVKGRKTTILGKDIAENAHYELRDMSDVIPSHDPENSFARRADYPAVAQERPYHSDRGEQEKVVGNARSYNPAFVVNTDPTAGNGPSIITPEGIVLGGNSRVMTLQMVYAGNPAAAETYKAALKNSAAQFGFKPEDVDGMKRPVLVRVVEGKFTPEEMAVKSRQYNQTTTQKLQSKAEGVSRARMVSRETLALLTEALTEFETLRQYLGSTKSKALINALAADGVIEQTELAAITEDKSGLLNEAGRTRVEETLRGLVLPDYDVLSSLPASILPKLDRAVPALARLKNRGEGWDLSNVLTAALRMIGKASSAGLPVDVWLAQTDLLNIDPDKQRPAVQALALTFANATQKEVLARVEAMAEASEKQSKGQSLLVAQPENTPASSFIRAFLQPLVSVGASSISNFNPQKNAVHAAIRWAYDHGGKGHTVEAAQNQLQSTLGKKVSREKKEQAREMLALLADYEGTISLYPPKLGQYFSYKQGQKLFQFIGERGAGIADYGEGVDTRMDNLRTAREMEESGKDAKTIKLATGWERGADGKWRYEIVDMPTAFDLMGEGLAGLKKKKTSAKRKATNLRKKWREALHDKKPDEEIDAIEEKLVEAENYADRLGAVVLIAERPATGGGFSVKLGHLVDNKELFTAYPDLAETLVHFDLTTDSSNGATLWDGTSGRINLYINSLEGMSGLLLHEVQHLIQHKEGFARGGSVEEFVPVYREYLEQDETINMLKENLSKESGLTEHMQPFIDDQNTSAQQLTDEYNAFIEASPYAPKFAEIDTKKKELREKYKKKLGEKLNPFWAYRSLAGENEAYNVQHRLRMSFEERRASLASETEDVARDDQIVLYQMADMAEAQQENAALMATGEKNSLGVPLSRVTVLDETVSQVELNESLESLAHKDLFNVLEEMVAQVNRKQRGKLASNVAAESSAQGTNFTKGEHRSAASQIENIWKWAALAVTSTDKKNNMPDVEIYRFVSSVKVHDKDAFAWITVKKTAAGLRIYSVELADEKKLRDKINNELADFANSGTDESATTTLHRSFEEIIARLGAPVKEGVFYQSAPAIEAQEAAVAEAKLAEDIQTWGKTVDDFMAGKKATPRREITMLRNTPLVLTLLGADKNLQVKTTYATLKKVLVDKHKLPANVLKQVPEALTHPVMIFDSATVGGDYVVMLDLKDENGATVVVPISLNYDGIGGYKINYVPSVYGKTEEGGGAKRWVQGALNEGRLRYQDTKKAAAWRSLHGLQLPGVGSRQTNGKKRVYTQNDLVKLKDAYPDFYQTAYHGTGALFDEFLLSHVGEGEGAQAHGFGLYFAQGKDISEGYRKKLSKTTSIKLDDKEYFVDEDGELAAADGQPIPEDMEDALYLMAEARSTEAAIRDIKKAIERDEAWADSPEELLTDESHMSIVHALEELEAGRGEVVKNSGQLFEVDIPEDDMLLDEQKTLEEQPEKVRNGVRRLFDSDVAEGETGREIYNALVKKTGSPRAASETLNAQGIKGITYWGHTDGRCFVVFDDEAIKIMDTYYQAQQRKEQLRQQVARGPLGSMKQGGNGTYTVKLFEGANLSTLLHETGHVFFMEMERLERHGQASQRILDDLEKLRKWTAYMDDDAHLEEEYNRTVRPLPPYNGRSLAELTPKEREDVRDRAKEEMMARGFEQYVREGKAPSKGLRGVFERFKRWLTRIYISASQLHVEITDEVRQVFDRMLATDIEMQAVAEGLGIRDETRQVLDALGLKGADRLKIEGMIADAVSGAADSLRHARDEGRDERLKKWKFEATREVEKERVYRTIDRLRKAKLNRNDIISAYGKDELTSLNKAYRGISANNGPSNPEIIAAEMGYSSGLEMIRDIATAPKFKERRKEVMDRKEAEWDAKFDAADFLFEQDALADLRERISAPLYEKLDAIINDTAGGTEQEKKARKAAIALARYRISQQQLKAQATRYLQKMSVPEAISPEKFRGAAAKWTQRERKAILKQDWEEAISANYKARISIELARQTAKQRDALKKLRKSIGRLLDNKSGHSGDNNINARYVIYELVRRTSFLDLKTKWIQNAQDKDAGTVDAFFKAMQEEGLLSGDDVAYAKPLFDDDTVRNWAAMSLHDFMHYAEVMAQVISVEKESRIVTTRQGEQDADTYFGAMSQSIYDHNKHREPGPLAERSEAMTALKKLHASHLKADTIALLLDGDEMGPVWHAVIDPINKATWKRAERLRKEKVTLEKLFDVYTQRERWKMRNEKYTVKGVDEAITKETALCVLLNCGNESNLKRLRIGQGLTDDQIRAIIDSLDEKDVLFAQAVWDYLETFRKEAFDLEESLTGMRPQAIEPQEVVTRFGTLRGGYYPVAYNTDLSSKAIDQDKVGTQTPGGMNATVDHGSVKSRTVNGSGAPLKLRLEVIPAHVAETVHMLAFRKPVRQVSRVLNRREVNRAIESTMGVEVAKALKDWLKYVAGERPAVTGWAKTISWARKSSALFVMGFKLATVLAQTTGMLASIAEIGPRWVASGMIHVLSHPVDAYKSAAAMSPMMRNRISAVDRDVYEASTALMNVGSKSRILDPIVRAQNKMEKYAFVPMGIWQMVCADLPTWHGAYRKALKEGKNVEDAVTYADAIVERTQVGGAEKDLAAVQRGGEMAKLMTMYYSYFSALYNLSARRITMLNRKRDAASVGRLASLTLLTWFAEPVLMGMMPGGGPDEEDPDIEDWIEWGALEAIKNPLNMIVGVREFKGFVESAYTGKTGRFKLTPLEDIGASVNRLALKLFHGDDSEEGTKEKVLAVGEAAGRLTGVVNAQSLLLLDVFWSWLDGTDPDIAFADFIRKQRNK